MSDPTDKTRIRWTAEFDRVQDDRSDLPPPVRTIGAEHVDIVYQPIVDLSNGRVHAYEALLRCTIDAYSSPDVLLRAAVEQAAIGRLGRTIREVAFERCPGVPLFVNVHPEELRSRWIVRPDDPMCLHDSEVFLEITESAAIEYYDLCVGVLRELCARVRAHLVVDDFGAGYSNLKRVVDLEPGVVKLDRALVSGIDSRPRQQILVEQLVNTCRALDAIVVAEGIETLDELKAVQQAGAQLGQGYLLARPAYPPPEVKWPL